MSSNSKASATIQEIHKRLQLRVQGLEKATVMGLAAFLSRGHLLLEGPPGTGKTSLAKAFAEILGGTFRRIQMTSDLLPSEIIGFMRPDGHGQFTFHEGPLFANFLLADELNRTSPKTQSALLEAMAEQSVTVDGTARRLPDPFFVIATENPAESVGVYPLAESQLDRFAALVEVGYPDSAQELSILENPGQYLNSRLMETHSPIAKTEIASLRSCVDAVFIEPGLLKRAHDILRSTREHPLVATGASVRAGLQFMQMARALAVIHGRDFVSPEDLREVSGPVLAHRLALASGSLLTSEKTDLIHEIIQKHKLD